MVDILQVGAVTATHGLAGEVKVFPTTDDPKRFKKLKTVLVETKKGMEELEIEYVKFFKNMVILKFRGFDHIEDAEAFRGCALYVTRDNAVKLEKDEYFIADLIGMTVYMELPSVSGILPEYKKALVFSDKGILSGPDAGGAGNNILVGKLTDVLQTGANDVYEVKINDGREVLIPAIRDCILDVDVENGIMCVHLLEGLL